MPHKLPLFWLLLEVKGIVCPNACGWFWNKIGSDLDPFYTVSYGELFSSCFCNAYCYRLLLQGINIGIEHGFSRINVRLAQMEY